jgi:hypothetical protein
VKPAPFSTAGAGDFTYSTKTLHFTTDSSTTQTIEIPVNDDGIFEQDEYIVLSLENAAGLTVTGTPFITLYIRDNDRKAPVPNKQLELAYVGSYDPSGTSNASSEIVVYDPASHRLFVISALQNRLDIADFSNPASIQPITSIDMTTYGGITSVAVKNGIVAVAAPNANQQLNGSVVFFNTNGVFQKQVTVGALPDMITFTPDGTKIMTANEGQPSDDYTADPEGSVSIIDISKGIAKLKQEDVTTLNFTGFNAQAAQLIAAGVRRGNPVTSLSQNMEPEYITFSADGNTAWVILQESNAFAVIDIKNKKVTDIWPLGTKDHSLPGNGFDASDRGNFAHIANWPVKGLYMPDGIAAYTVNGTTFIVGANEGDDREYSAFNERVRVSASSYKLDSAKFPHAAMLKNDNNLGRLRITTASGDTDGDGDFDEIHLIGGRSFSIWNTTTKSVVYDSKDDFEQYIAKTPLYAPIFNADHESNTFKSRSSSKGPEPEGLTLANIQGKQFAFIALERQGGIMVYDITDPNHVQFVDYNNPRLLNTYGGDNGPEGIVYISNTVSPDGKHYIVVANEVSGTLSIYKLTGPAVEPPVVRAEDMIVKEDDHAKVDICLSATTNETVKVQWYTTSGSARALLDYVPRFGTAVVPAGASCTQVFIPVINNRMPESNEEFYIHLHSPVNAKIEDEKAVVTIIDNDGYNHPGNNDEHGQNGKVQVYPNPFGNSFTVTIQSSVDEYARLVLTDVSGRQVRDQKVKLVYGFNRVTIEGLGKLEEGTYFLRIVSESRSEVIKVIKN